MRTRRRSPWFLAGLMALVLGAPTAARREPVVEGGTLSFQVHDLDGNVVNSTDPRFDDKVVFVDLWGTWCPPCITEIPTFVDLHSRYGAQGLVIVGMAFEREADPEKRRERLRDFAREHDVNYLLLDGGDLADFEKILPALQGVRGFPVEIFIDRDGTVVETRNGYTYTKRWARRLERKLAGLLAPAPTE